MCCRFASGQGGKFVCVGNSTANTRSKRCGKRRGTTDGKQHGNKNTNSDNNKQQTASMLVFSFGSDSFSLLRAGGSHSEKIIVLSFFLSSSLAQDQQASTKQIFLTRLAML